MRARGGNSPVATKLKIKPRRRKRWNDYEYRRELIWSLGQDQYIVLESPEGALPGRAAQREKLSPLSCPQPSIWPALGALLSSPALNVRLPTALQVLQPELPGPGVRVDDALQVVQGRARALPHHTPLLKIPASWRCAAAAVFPSLLWKRGISFSFCAPAPPTQRHTSEQRAHTQHIGAARAQ